MKFYGSAYFKTGRRDETHVNKINILFYRYTNIRCIHRGITNSWILLFKVGSASTLRNQYIHYNSILYDTGLNIHIIVICSPRILGAGLTLSPVLTPMIYTCMRADARTHARTHISLAKNLYNSKQFHRILYKPVEFYSTAQFWYMKLYNTYIYVHLCPQISYGIFYAHSIEGYMHSWDRGDRD